MRIAIPLDEDRLSVCPVLARAPYFLFSAHGEESIEENPAAQAQSGAGMQAAQFLVNREVGVLITPRCGEKAAEVLGAAGMEIFKSANKAAADDLAAYGEGKLERLSHFHGGFQGIG